MSEFDKKLDEKLEKILNRLAALDAKVTRLLICTEGSQEHGSIEIDVKKKPTGVR